MRQLEANPAVVTYRLLVRHAEALALANLAALLSCLLVIPAPLGIAGLLGVVEAAWRKPARRVGWGEFRSGIRRFWKNALALWLAALFVLLLAAVSLWLYGRMLEGTRLVAVLVFELFFLVFLWCFWLYALSGVLIDRARSEGRISGGSVGLVEGFSHHAAPAVSAWLLQVVLIITAAGFIAVGLALPLLYLAVAAGEAPDLDAG